MEEIKQLIKKGSQIGEYDNVFPRTFIDAIKDKETGASLSDILSGYNMYFLSYTGSDEYTRLEVPMSIRRQGLWITYVKLDKTIVTEWYNSDLVDDDNWKKDEYWMKGSNMLVGDLSVSTSGTWIIDGYDTKVRAQGEQGVTPMLRVEGNKLQVSYTNGTTWNVLSDYISTWFRWYNTGEGLGKIQMSKDQVNWTDLSPEFVDNLKIKGYVIQQSLLPANAAQGEIWMVGTAAPFTMFIRNGSDWINNGQFTSIEAGITQELGDSVLLCPSQNLVTTQFRRVDALESKGFIDNTAADSSIKELVVFSNRELYVTLLSVSSTKVAISLSDTSGVTVATLTSTPVSEENIYRIPSKDGNSDYGYVMFNLSSPINVSSVKYKLSQKSYNISYSGNISAYLNKLTEDYIHNSSSFFVAPTKIVEDCVKEIYINSDYSNTFYVRSFRWNTTINSYILAINREDGTNWGSLVLTTTIPEFDEPYSINILDGSKDTGYVVFKNNSVTAVENANMRAFLNKNIYDYSKSPIIERMIISSLIPNNSEIMWTNNKTVNSHIKELYIPDIVAKFGEGCYITAVSVTDKITRFFFKTSSGTLVTAEGRDVTPEYYSVGSIMALYEYSTKQDIIGWVILDYDGTNYSVSGLTVPFYSNTVSDINNSPTIKNMLECGKQIWFVGDSLLGYPANNCAVDMLAGITGVEVLNCACGGCRMSYRTSDGSNYYDKFCFVDICNSLISHDFSIQIKAMEDNPSLQQYNYQLANLKRTDITKDITILCSYINNDVTAGVLIGDLWKYTDDVASYNKTTFLGAMNYGVESILTKNPKLKISFITDSYRWRTSNGVSVPPYAYINSSGLSASEYTNAEIENCSRLGLSVNKFSDWGIRNAFSMNSVTTDGTHFNGYGFSKLSYYLYNIVQRVK